MRNKTIALLLAALMVTVAGIGIVSAETGAKYTAQEWYSYMSEHMANFMGRGDGYGMMGGNHAGYDMMNGNGTGYGMINGSETGACLAYSDEVSTGEVAGEPTDFAQYRTGRQGGNGRMSGMGYGMMYTR